MFHGSPFLFLAVGFSLILKFFRIVLLVHKVSRSCFPDLTTQSTLHAVCDVKSGIDPLPF